MAKKKKAPAPKSPSRSADALHAEGVALRQAGDLDGAEERIRRAIELSPSSGAYHASLARVFAERGDSLACIAELERAIELEPELVVAVFNLGLAWEEQGDLGRAEDHYRRASEGAAGVPEAAYNLGNLYLAASRIEDAVASYTRAIELRPAYAKAWSNLGYAHQKAGAFALAAGAYESLLKVDPDDVQARHMLAALSGKALDRADPDYVARFFDDYAARFEDVLVKDLGYATPKAIAALCEEHRDPSRSFARALDLGCGTGLAGRAIRPLCGSLIGVDLSTNMLEKAHAAGGYDELVAGDLLEFLHSDCGMFDLVVASDVLNYLGDLAETFRAIAKRAAPKALIVFSTEASDDIEEFALEKTGRFSHARTYVERVVTAAGLTVVECEETQLRMERGVPVRGHLFVLRAP
jgi:predicted TPR repeat methyltransferase